MAVTVIGARVTVVAAVMDTHPVGDVGAGRIADRAAGDGAHRTADERTGDTTHDRITNAILRARGDGQEPMA